MNDPNGQTHRTTSAIGGIQGGAAPAGVAALKAEAVQLSATRHRPITSGSGSARESQAPRESSP